jgi:tripartite-type tricarboxylate transporter receptor subunit TctC
MRPISAWPSIRPPHASRTTAWTHAIPGVGATSQLAIEMMRRMAHGDIQEIAYRSGGPALQSALAGETGMLAMPAAAAMPLIQAGQLRALGATTRARSPVAPDVPSFQEPGFAGFGVVEQVAMLAPAGMPEPVLRRLNNADAGGASRRAGRRHRRWLSSSRKPGRLISNRRGSGRVVVSIS